jgi:hypothetical protein
LRNRVRLANHRLPSIAKQLVRFLLLFERPRPPVIDGAFVVALIDCAKSSGSKHQITRIG